MNFKKLYFALLFLISTSFAAFSQTDTIGLKTVVSKAVKVANEHPFEKVYLHFDKPYYAVGDTIWFKAYVTIDMHILSQLSKIVYVDVISAKDSIVQSLKLQVAGGTAIGNVMLYPNLYRQGNYHIRAYTNWMRNEDVSYFFNKTIAVGSFNTQIVTNISLSGSTKGNTSKVTAKVIYKDATGKPFANKKVTWKAANDDTNLGKGRGVTSANGVLEISFTTNKTAEIASSSLETEIEVNDGKNITNTFGLAKALDQPDVQFFPEGGDLLAGVRSRVAFKAVKPNGLGVDIKGTVVDNSGATVAEFTSTHLGMGQFAMQPENDKTYKANITFADGSQTSVDLPKTKADGIALAVYNTDPANLSIKLSANTAFFQKNQNKNFYIIGQNGQTICFAAQTLLQNNVYGATIAKTKFPSGVIKFTLLNDRGEALAERITFIQRNDLMNLTLKTPQAVYNSRQGVTLNISAQSGGQPAESNLSVAVIDETKVPFDENAETTILTNILLTSDLKGFVEQPNYYFNKADDKTNADLDILMLTQGYRRFLYKDIIAGKYQAPKFLPEQGINITGTIRNGTGLPINRGNVQLQATDLHIIKNAIANTVGEFKFSNLQFPDSTKLSLNARNNPNPSNMLIILDNSTFQPVTPNTDGPAAITNIDSTMNLYLQNSKQQSERSHLLKEVVIKEKPPEKKPSHEDYPQLTGLSMQPDHMVAGSQLAGCNFLAQCLVGSLLGATYYENNIYVTRSYTAGDKTHPMAIYYNGLAVDYDYLNSVAAADVESIEIFLNDGLSGINKMSNTNGVLVINGKKVVKKVMSRDEVKKALADLQYSTISTVLRGYTQARVFYSPKYDPTKNNSFGGDLRTTIYWNPKVITDKTGNASVQFFNSDGKGSYRAIVEGIDANGNIGRTVYRYKVQ